METIWKIFELKEITIKDNWDNQEHTAIITQEWAGNFQSEDKALDVVKAHLKVKEFKHLILIVRKVYTFHEDFGKNQTLF